ncbi:hypothetical protein, partial [Escherichia coli]
EGETMLTVINGFLMTNWLTMPSKLVAQFLRRGLSRSLTCFFSYLHLTLSGVFLLLFLRFHYLPAG